VSSEVWRQHNGGEAAQWAVLLGHGGDQVEAGHEARAGGVLQLEAAEVVAQQAHDHLQAQLISCGKRKRDEKRVPHSMQLCIGTTQHLVHHHKITHPL
jgi:hypothetical protein